MLFNHQELYEKIKEKFQDKGYDVEDGQNIQQIGNVMAYLVSVLNQNTSINVRETILSAQTKRDMILEDARLLGYEAIPKRSYIYKINVHGTGTVDKFDKFVSGSNTYYYLGETVQLSGTSEQNTIEIKVSEGDLKKYTDNDSLVFVVQNNQEFREKITVPFTDVEENGIFLTVSSPNGDETWKKSQSYLLGSDLQNKEFLRIDDIDFSTPNVYFKYADFGETISINSTIKVSVLISKGSEGAADGDFSADSSNIEVLQGSELVVQGTNEESNESIKRNAVIVNNTLGRIVTIGDYISITSRQPQVYESIVWDGFEEYTNLPGVVYYSFVPSSITRSFSRNIDTWLLDDQQSQTNYIADPNEVISYVKKFTLPTLRHIHRNPVYADFSITVKTVKFNANEDPQDIKNAIFNAIDNFFKNDGVQDLRKVEKFNGAFHLSELTEYVHSSLALGNTVDLSATVTLRITDKHIPSANDSGGMLAPFKLEFLGSFIENEIVDSSVIPEIKINGSTKTYSNWAKDTSYTGEMKCYKSDDSTFRIYDLDKSAELLLSEPSDIEIKFVNNISFNKNTFPRLYEVKII